MELKALNVGRQYMRKTRTSNVFFAVKDASITLKPGEITALYGRSGSGKSTLLNMLSGILKPTEGTVTLGDTDIYSMNDRQLSRFRNEHYGIIPQDRTAIGSLTVLENVLLPAAMYGNGREKEKEALELLSKTGIEDLKNIMPEALSGGELRRMAIARALIKNPDVIIADEPTADLDEENTQAVLKLLRKIADEGRIVFAVTHDKEVIDFADVVYHMDKGHLTKGE